MSEDIKPIPSEEAGQESISSPVLSVTVTLPISGETVELHKLKAGKYYQAQKLYVGWLQNIQSVLAMDSEEIAKTVNEKGELDTAKIKKVAQNKKMDVGKALGMAENAAQSQIDILAVCLGLTKEEIEDKYYPEDIGVLVKEALQLNDFVGNVKKSVAL